MSKHQSADLKQKIDKSGISQSETKKSLIPDKYKDLLFILLIAASVFIFFWGAISGGGFNTSDNIASNSFITYLDDAKADGEFPQWITYIFGGMPSYASLLTTGARWWDFIAQLFFGFTRFMGDIFLSDVARVITFYIFYGVGMYLLMRSKKHERTIAFITAFAAIFSTYVITWAMIGHNTKPIVLAMFPYIYLLVEKLRTKFSILFSVLLVFAVHLMYEGNHVQMMFYFACSIGIYFLFEVISRLISKAEPVKVLRSAGLLLIAGVFAFFMSSDRYLTTLEYTPESTRGSAPIAQVESQHADAPAKDYKYSTMWSYNPGEMFSFLVPGFFGATPIEYNGQETTIYFGAKESEDSPPYMGIGILAFALIGVILYRKDVFVQSMFGISIFSIIISFGKNAPPGSEWYILLLMFVSFGLILYFYFKKKVNPIALGLASMIFLIYITNIIGIHSFDMFKLYDVMFWNLPMFYTFRAPSMALALLHFAVPILAGYGLSGLIKMRQSMTKNEQILVYSALTFSVLFLVTGFVYSAGFRETFDGFIANKLASALNGQSVPEQISSALWNAMTADWYFSAFILIVFMASVYFFIKGKIAKPVLFSIIVVALAVDLWRVDYRPMDVSEQKLADQVFAPYAQFYNQLSQDKDLFRVVDFAAPHSNAPAYFRLQSVGGYHPAKLRVVQDLMDVANIGGQEGSTHQIVNPFLWNLMNVKYIIDRDRNSNNGQPKIYPNPEVLPRAFFVNNYAVAKPLDILKRLKAGDFNPRDTMFTEAAIGSQIAPADSNAVADVTEYKNQYIKINTKNSGNNLLFISEIYYKPSWKAYVNGKETPIIKANYAFRAVVVPPGENVIEMKYHSDKFELGKNLSLATNAVFIILFGLGIFFFKRKKSESD